MKIRASTGSAGLLVTEDGFGVQSVRLSAGVPARVRRIAKLAEVILNTDVGTPGLEAASLAVFDAVRPCDLGSAAAGLRSIFQPEFDTYGT